MKINETTTGQCRHTRRIGTWLSVATFALSVSCTLQSASAAVRVTVPDEAPGIPEYARFGHDPAAGWLILHDEKWSAIPFYRGPGCVPSDFNLIEGVDLTPDPDYGLRVFGCPLTVAGFEVWSVYDPATTTPLSTVLMGPVQPYPFVAVYLVNNDELLAAMADGLLTIGELEALPSRKIGHATFFQEINGTGHLTEDGQYTSLHYELTASGTLAEDASKTFSVHVTTGGRFARSPKAYPNPVQAEIRFGK